MYLRDQPNESVNAETSLSGELISQRVMVGVGMCVHLCVVVFGGGGGSCNNAFFSCQQW